MIVHHRTGGLEIQKSLVAIGYFVHHRTGGLEKENQN